MTYAIHTLIFWPEGKKTQVLQLFTNTHPFFIFQPQSLASLFTVYFEIWLMKWWLQAKCYLTAHICIRLRIAVAPVQRQHLTKCVSSHVFFLLKILGWNSVLLKKKLEANVLFFMLPNVSQPFKFPFHFFFLYDSFKLLWEESVCRNQSLCSITTRWQWKTVHTVQAAVPRLKRSLWKLLSDQPPATLPPHGKRSTLPLDLTFFVGDYHCIS